MDIQAFTPHDLEDLVRLNKSLIPIWYGLEGTDRITSRWEDLTIKERFLHGGPWNDQQTLKIHTEEFLKFGQIDLIKDQNGQILGEIEYHQHEDTIHLDWMMIHGTRQLQGLGSLLLHHLVQVAEQDQINEIWTEPENGVEKFYEKNGFKLLDESIHRYQLKSDNTRESWGEIEYSEIKGQVLSGEANNDRDYLLMLLRSGIRYAEICGEPYPIRGTRIEDNLVISRYLPALSPKAHLAVFGPQVFSDWHRLPSILESGTTYSLTLHEQVNYQGEISEVFKLMKRQID